MKSRIVKTALAVLSTVVLIVIFQNCSVTHFAKDYTGVNLSSSFSDGSLDSKAGFYTNSRTLPIVVDVTSYDFTEVRASIYENMDEKSVEWQKLNGELHKNLVVDLGEQFSADGSKDGQKMIYVESRDPITKKVLKSQIMAYLDTQAPVMTRKGLLENGIQGATYVKGQAAKLEWLAEDKTSSSGFKSDLDPAAGFRWGMAESGDCSESSLVSKTEWGPNKNQMEIEWPGEDPLKAFYFCLYVKDRAGNVSNLLSQPMSSLWNVIAGDNSQGNGSSVTSNKVRFKFIANLFIDNDKNIELVDSYFNVRRVIKAFEIDPSRTIEQSQFNKNFPSIQPSSAAVIDSEGYYYITNSTNVYRLSPDQSTMTKFISRVESADVHLAIRKYKGVESLLISRTVLITPNNTSAKDFLLEIPLSKIKEMTAPISMDDAIAAYRIAGNGIVPPSSFAVPSSVKLSKTDPVLATDNEHSLGSIKDIAAGENGDIYVSTAADGGGRGWGNHTIRRLRPNSDGSFQQTVIASGGDANWVLQLAYKKPNLGGNSHDYLFAAKANGAIAIDLETLEKSRPFTEVTTGYITATALVPILGNTDYEIYFASGSSSRLYRYNSKFELIEALGRDTSDVNVNNALASVLGNPDGLYQDPDSNIYVADSQTGVLQKVNPAGQMEAVIGTYGANSSFINSYSFRLEGDFDKSKDRKIIYSSINFADTSKIYAHDLVAKHSYLLYEPSKPSLSDSKFDWPLNSTALLKGADDKNTLLMSRSWHSAVTADWHTGVTSFIGKLTVSGVSADLDSRSVFAGDIMKGAAETGTAPEGFVNNSEMILGPYTQAKIVIDSLNNIFSSGNYLAISRLDQTKSRNINLKISGAFAVVEEKPGSPLRHIIYQRGDVLGDLVIDLTNIADPAIDPRVMVNKKLVNSLCLPGTGLRGVRDIIKDNEGNLLISDSQNARVLKYRIRDAAGNLKLSYCN
jgi:hypothetical protein